LWVSSRQTKPGVGKRVPTRLVARRSSPESMAPSISQAEVVPLKPAKNEAETVSLSQADHEASPVMQELSPPDQREVATADLSDINIEDELTATMSGEESGVQDTERDTNAETAGSSDADPPVVVGFSEALTASSEGIRTSAAEPAQSTLPELSSTLADAARAEQIEDKSATSVESASGSDVEPISMLENAEIMPVESADDVPTATQGDSLPISISESEIDPQLLPDPVETSLAALMSRLRASGFEPEMTDDGAIRLNLYKEVAFTFDSANVSPASRQSITNIAEALVAYPNVRLTVIGHTDDSGPAEYNTYLSRMRASAVAALFRANGVSDEMVTSEGRGEDEPLTSVAIGGIPANTLNRRIELIMHEIEAP